MKNILSKVQTLFFFLKPRKVVAQYKLFFGDDWLEVSVDSIAPYVHKILFVVSEVAWGDNIENPSTQGDDLTPIFDKLQEKYPSKIVIIKGKWNKQIPHVEAGLDYIKKHIPEATHCLYIDGDEIYTKTQIEELLELIKKWKYFNSAIRLNYYTYFKSIYYRIDPINYALCLTLFPIRPWVHYRNERNVNAKIIERPDMFFEHPAYVRKDDEKMRNKIEAHKETEPIYKNWYHDVWLKWTPEMKNFHPTHPDIWESVVKVDPKELPVKMVKTFESWQKS